MSVPRTAARAAAMALAAGVALSGCGSAPPVRPLDAELDLPAAWGTEPEAAATPAPVWTHLGDPALGRLVDEAIVNNRDLAAAAARLEAAAAEARIAGADVLPAVNLAANASRSRQVLTFIRNPVTGAPLESINNSYGISLDVSWELDLWGRLRSQRSAGAADLQAAAADYRAARVSIAAQTTKAWFAAIEATRQMELADETAASYERTVERIRSRYRQGLRPSIDLRLASVDLATARSTAATRRLAHDRAVRQLEIVLGRYPAASAELPADLPDPPPAVPAGLPADALARRPDLIAAERRLAAANRRAASAHRALFPRLQLTASGGRVSDQLEDLLKGDFSVWSLAGGLLQPLFQGGRLRAGADRARAGEDAALADWAGSVLRACAEIETLLAAEGLLAEEEAARAAAAGEARAAYDLAQNRYERGLDNVITLLSAQRSAALAESALLDVRRRRLASRVDLHLALGGDFDTATREGAETQGDAS